MFKKVMSLALASTLVLSAGAFAASAAEAEDAVAANDESAVAADDSSAVAAGDESQVGAGTKIPPELNFGSIHGVLQQFTDEHQLVFVNVGVFNDLKCLFL